MNLEKEIVEITCHLIRFRTKKVYSSHVKYANQLEIRLLEKILLGICFHFEAAYKHLLAEF